MSRLVLLLSVFVGLALVATAPAQPVQQKALPVAPEPRAPWGMFGGTPTRNMVNLHDRDVLRAFNPKKGLELLWKAELGTRCYTQPVVVGGKVFVSTNNEKPRNKRDRRKPTKDDPQGEPLDKGIVMCFDAQTGKFLWQAVHDKLEKGGVNDWPQIGVASTPAVAGDRVYYVSNQCRVVCVDVNGFLDGNQGIQTEKYKDDTDADIVWEYDMIRELDVYPHNLANCSPLVVGDLLFVCTSNGVDESHINLPSPDAPSFICLNRHTGKLVWKDASPGKDIMHGQWASPCYTDKPSPQVIFPGGDGWLRAFDPPTGKLLWKFDGNRKGAKFELGGTGDKSDFLAAPVVCDGRVYIGTGQDPEHASGTAFFWCIDLKKAVEFGAKAKDRDVSPEVALLAEKRADGSEEYVIRANQMSALEWVYGGEENRKFARRDFKFGRTLSTACVVDGIVYVAELDGYLHCLDAKTGKHYWQYDTKASIWGSPYYVDGKVLLGTSGGDLFVFKHDPKPEVIDELDVIAPNLKEARAAQKLKRKMVEEKYLLFKTEFDAAILGTPTVVGGVLYVATDNALYAYKRPENNK